METRRLLLAFFLSIAFLVFWNWLFPPTQPVQPEPVAPPAEQLAQEAPEPRPGGAESAGAEEPPERPELGRASAEEGRGQETVEAAPIEPIAADRESRAVLETERFRAELSNRGAQLVSFLLKRHLTHEGDRLELVRERGADPYPLALIDRSGEPHRLNDALFTLERAESVTGGEELRFRHRSALGDAEKVIRLTEEGFLDVEVRVAGAGGWSLLMGPGVRNLTSKEEGDRFLEPMVGYRLGEELEKKDPKDVDETIVVAAPGLRWVSLEDKYFLGVVVPREGVDRAVMRPVLQRRDVAPGEPRFLPVSEEESEEELRREVEVLLEAEGESLRALAFLGAKKYSQLSRMPYGIGETVRWGVFGFLVRPLYFGLEWIYREVVSNYGWAIVLMTFLIKLVFFPLTHKSQESMGKMQELNPKVQAIRSKYRSKLKDKQGRPNVDAQRQMNDEVMAVYRSAGVNPAAGCLPILLQIPVFFAFYKLLAVAVELRNAPWIAWVKDLSEPDPLFILPVAMGVSGIALQKITPAAPDPMQRRIMQMMPIMFAIFAFAFPSGLVLYWLTNNLLTMVQQVLYMRHKKKREAAKDQPKASSGAEEKTSEEKSPSGEDAETAKAAASAPKAKKQRAKGRR